MARSRNVARLLAVGGVLTLIGGILPYQSIRSGYYRQFLGYDGTSLSYRLSAVASDLGPIVVTLGVALLLWRSTDERWITGAPVLGCLALFLLIASLPALGNASVRVGFWIVWAAHVLIVLGGAMAAREMRTRTQGDQDVPPMPPLPPEV